MKVFNLTRNIVISGSAEKADTFMSRLFGLIPRESLGEEEGLWLEPCSSIHMCFMRFAIDAVFLDKDFRVIRILENFRPWRFSPFVKGSRGVLELPAGRCAGRVGVGDIIEFR